MLSLSSHFRNTPNSSTIATQISQPKIPTLFLSYLDTHTHTLSMAIPKVLIASIFLSLLVLHGVQAIQTNQVTSNAVSETADSPKMDCGGACAARCSLSKRPNLCKRACGACCARCNCVPPGTYGNYEACPCYAEMTTRDSKPKCP